VNRSNDFFRYFKVITMYVHADNLSDFAGSGSHVPVLLNEVRELLSARAGAKLLDATFGGGGHSRALLSADEASIVVAIDCDPAALERSQKIREEFGERFRFYSMNFANLADLEESGFDGILFDFGLSSFQLDQPERGFSFRFDAPIDMRMNPDKGISAAEFLETCEEEALIRAVRTYGEETRWRRVVNAILNARGTGRLQRTASFAALIAEATGPASRGKKSIHPATRTFQGIRIEINGELDAIQRALPIAFERLVPEGVLAAISFHSLEDRIVKRFCRRVSGRPEHAEDSRTADERTTRATMISTRPVCPTEQEIKINPRSRSARMRAVRKLSII
jgi:16S rRNA (cytosine1402-N4)-methyltransferase